MIEQQDSVLLNEIHAMVREQKMELRYIKEQTTKTNGRVFKLEDKMDDVEKNQSTMNVKVATGIFFASLLSTMVVGRVIDFI